MLPGLCEDLIFAANHLNDKNPQGTVYIEIFAGETLKQ
jgi:hypothetical protein